MKKLAFFIAALLSTTIIFSQSKPVKKNTSTLVTIAKFKPPVTKTYLDKFSGTTSCSAVEGKRIIATGIIVKDASGNGYTIASYQLAYRTLESALDTAGNVVAAPDMHIQRFTETPLPQIWIDNIVEKLHKGEQLYFFDVMVRDNKGRLFKSADLKINIQ